MCHVRVRCIPAKGSSRLVLKMLSNPPSPKQMACNGAEHRCPSTCSSIDGISLCLSSAVEGIFDDMLFGVSVISTFAWTSMVIGCLIYVLCSLYENIIVTAIFCGILFFAINPARSKSSHQRKPKNVNTVNYGYTMHFN